MLAYAALGRQDGPLTGLPRVSAPHTTGSWWRRRRTVRLPAMYTL